jgi:glycosyltransferase involved in cell wall biosynthesis
MPHILLNTTVINKGGALQTSSNFIAQILRQPSEFTWHFALSAKVAAEAKALGAALPDTVEIFPESPARNSAARKRLRALADRLQPDAVFTFSGPAYVPFQQRHLLGCSEAWVTHGGLAAYRTLDFPREWFTFGLTTLYKMWWMRRADMWVMQTESSRQGLHRRLRIPLAKIHVISNTCGAQYFAAANEERPFPDPSTKVRIFCFSAPYKHKNLALLPPLAAALQNALPTREFEIVLTLPPDGPDWRRLQTLAQELGVSARFVNHGPVPVSGGPALFRSCDLLVLPTVLETFSATYPEAMALGLPIVTSDLDFARDICGPAALYFPPWDAAAGAAQVQRLLADETLWRAQIAHGKAQLATLPHPGERSAAYLELLRKLVKHQR